MHAVKCLNTGLMCGASDAPITAMDSTRRLQRARLRALERDTGLTLTRIAEEAGVAHTTLTRLFDPEHKYLLSSRTLARLRDRFPEFDESTAIDAEVFAELLRPVLLSAGYGREEAEGILRFALSGYEAVLGRENEGDPVAAARQVGRTLAVQFARLRHAARTEEK